MDEYDFRKIDREEESRIAELLGYRWQYDRWVETPYAPKLELTDRWQYEINHSDLSDWNARMETDDIGPPACILVPIGEYDGQDVGPIEVDQDYIVWLAVKNPEYDCQVIIH